LKIGGAPGKFKTQAQFYSSTVIVQNYTSTNTKSILIFPVEKKEKSALQCLFNFNISIWERGVG
jgi:hypothetical protein